MKIDYKNFSNSNIIQVSLGKTLLLFKKHIFNPKNLFCLLRRLCSSDLSIQSDCSAPLLAHNLYQSSSTIASSSQSLLHNSYRHLVSTQQQNSPSLIGGLNLSSSSSATSALTPPVAASSSAPTQTITTLSNNLYNNSHLYQHHNASGSGHGSKHNSSASSGASAAISHHHPTPIEGLTALSSLGSSTLHLSNSLCGGSSNSLTAAELGMSQWLSDGGSNSGETRDTCSGNIKSHTCFFTVKTELKSPATIVDANGLPLSSSHLDSTLFCSTPVNLDATQSSNNYDHKQDYYNYYNR